MFLSSSYTEINNGFCSNINEESIRNVIIENAFLTKNSCEEAGHVWIYRDDIVYEDKKIYSIRDYNRAMELNSGVYRYTNLNNSKIYFNDNIERLVQNYRIGFIRLAQYDIERNNYNEAEKMIDPP